MMIYMFYIDMAAWRLILLWMSVEIFDLNVDVTILLFRYNV